jgi:tetratricopeptide (TPR) repeat protein
LARDPVTPEVLEGEAALEELSADSALVLWTLYRDTLLWASVPREHRGCVFHPGGIDGRRALIAASPLDGDAREAAGSLAELLLTTPATAKPPDVSAACVTLAEWAESGGHGRTALLLAKAGSAASPNDAAYTLIAGRIAERFGWHSHALSWLRRTIALARRQGDWVSYVEGYLSVGQIALAQHRLELATRNYARAFRVARRKGLRAVRAKALHGRFRVAAATGTDDAAAVQYGEAARRAYRNSPAVAALQHELAAVRMRLEGASVAEAAAFLTATHSPDTLSHGQKIEALMAAVRAAAEKEDAALLADAWFTAVAAIEDLGETNEAADFLERLVEAAGGALERRRAQETLRRAEEIAMRANRPAQEAGALGIRRYTAIGELGD